MALRMSDFEKHGNKIAPAKRVKVENIFAPPVMKKGSKELYR
jgi:hypothetical protein